MFSGKLKRAGDIKVGDQLMGDDSRPRKVLSICTGEDDMYEVIPVKGESFKCNKEHILVLRHRTGHDDDKIETITISVYDYLKKSKSFKRRTRLFKPCIPLKFQNTHTPKISPYLLGLWIADGRKGRSSFSVNHKDVEIEEFLYSEAQKIEGVEIAIANRQEQSKDIGLIVKQRKKANPIINYLKELNVLNNKHIPYQWKIMSVEDRLEFLAGYIDGDGYLHANFTTRYLSSSSIKAVTDGIAFICNSLGFNATQTTRSRYDKRTDKTYTAYDLTIVGDIERIPTKIKRKQINGKSRETAWNIFPFEIKPLGRGEYCGFTLDDNHKFLLGSFIVSHNTFCSIVAMLVHAQRNKKLIRCAVVRDTHENIKISVVRAVQEMFPPSLYIFKNDFKNLIIKSEPHVVVDLFGIDDLAALQKLQGPEYSLVWLEEPAPMSDKANAGLSEDVYNAALIVCARQKDTIARLQVSMNPADQDHWTYRRFLEAPAVDPENPLITKAVFAIPYRDNTNLPEQARQAVKVAYANDPASYARYVDNKFVAITKGKKVTPDYGTGRYTSERPLEPAPGLEGFIGFDGWHNPCASIGQITHTGRLVFIDTIVGNNIDIRTLIEQKVQPLLNSPRWIGKCRSWRYIGDCSMKIPDQSNINESAARVIEDKLGGYFEGGPARWTHMKRGVDHIFNTNIAGKPAFIVNKENRLLDKALSGGWCFKTDNAGNVISDVPLKNSSSHVADSWANTVNVLLPSRSKAVNREAIARMQHKGKTRAASYSV
jgi:hypothetical protein